MQFLNKARYGRGRPAWHDGFESPHRGNRFLLRWHDCALGAASSGVHEAIAQIDKSIKFVPS